MIVLQFEQGLSLLAAWRNYRGLSQTDLAELVGISLSELVALEQPDYQLPPSSSHDWQRRLAFSTNT
ncbi:helix-turn-helix domain-containing protein [Aeromonas caviae]|uniref:helix-turn-helix domain-containing protein n=1 Tax=Aeromonas caviae TaxID=648 RepID=UPI000F6332EF|nr:helix-turn-helix transcriptional regulator [Aeromonas caviae]GJA86102.1 hypothetical protein KAM356_21610 [Aeromonas caviae]GJA90084.1 hypothetical protein KAM357_20320 [Aeromonas caviae]GJB07364.1 hypothetical protein KAM361_20370 [Aeromonas caviae]GJB15931.1 hypothetical protein KAM363_19360 [Aeromonas caviae]GJB29716.1 hypothetical protein KAM366_29130 [Aeromonas caviae]